MAYTKYSLTPANNTATPPDGAPEGMLPSAVNDTMRDMMAQIRDVGDGIRGGTYTMTAPVITGGTITGVAFTGNTFTSPVISGGSINNTPIGATTANTGAFTTLSATGVATFSAGTVSAPAITTSGDTNTGIFFPAADTIAFTEGGVEAMRIDSSGNVGIGTSSPASFGKLTVYNSTALDTYGVFGNNLCQIYVGTDTNGDSQLFNTASKAMLFKTNFTERMRIDSSGNVGIGTSSPVTLKSAKTLQVFGNIKAGDDNGKGLLSLGDTASTGANVGVWRGTAGAYTGSSGTYLNLGGYDGITFTTGNADIASQTERMRITSSGDLLVSKTGNDDTSVGLRYVASQYLSLVRDGNPALYINRLTNDGRLVEFAQANTIEGDISVSGTTVSYNGGHLSRYAQTTTAKDESLVKGTVLSNLDEMNEYVDAEGNVVPNEQLNKVKVSDVEGDVNVAGVFVNWSHDEAHNVDEINMAMTGDMIIRIAQGVVVQKGDLLMSAGDGTAKPQGDDIVRSKTIAKVTSNHVTCTYADGSYCVPCVLMAC
jgi:hypothetical protein